jgi:hypothetical protein
VGALGNLRVKFHIVLDRETKELRGVVERNLKGYEVDIEALPGVGNFATFRRLIDVATTQSSADLVLLAEDDYLYTENAIAECVSFMRRDPATDFVTPFRHTSYEQATEWARAPYPVTPEREWEAAPYTTLTFMATVDALRAARRGFLSFCHHNFDTVLWMQLTRSLTPWRLFTAAVRTRDLLLFKFLVKAVLYRPFFVGVRGPMRLCVPSRSLATHLESTDIVDPAYWLDVASRVDAEGQHD